MIRVLYLSNIDETSSVFKSQVLTTIDAWKQAGARVDFAFRSRLSASGQGEGTHLKALPSLGPASWFIDSLFWNLRLDQYDLIHCRGVETAWFATRAKQRKARVIYDCRGAAVEELAVNSAASWRKPLLSYRQNCYRKAEADVVSRSDLVTAVSPGLSGYLQLHYGRSADVVQPCVVSSDFKFNLEERERKRSELRIGKRPTYVFVGFPAPWQCLDALGNWWNKRSQMPDQPFLVVLTQKPDQFLQSARLEKNSHSLVVTSSPHANVPDWLSAADFGVLFRDESVVNQVSSPVKISEYLAMGLPVITNQPYFVDIGPADIFLESLDHPVIRSSRENNERELKSSFYKEHLSAQSFVSKITQKTVR